MAMNISLLSFNFKNTRVELREKLALTPGHLAEFLPEAKEANRLGDLMVLSTCNRVEFYYTGSGEDGVDVDRRLLDWLARRFLVESGEMENAAVKLQQEPALNHLYRVASSLESMVIGEPQILGQLKDAYQIAVDARTTGQTLTGLMPKVFHAAKRVRTETGIARYAVSVSYVAAELAGRIFETLHDKTVMVIGAGEMAELALSHLQKKGIRRLLITNRTLDNAVALAEKYQGEAVRYEDLAQHLEESDIVISSTGARDYIIDKNTARTAMKARKGQPIFFIDIAVPRDIDPAVNELSDIYCYDIDDLQSAADENRAEREREALAAQGVIIEEIERYKRWSSANQMGPVVTALRKQFVETTQAELEKAMPRLSHLAEGDRQQVQKLMNSVVNKLLHLPSSRLRMLGEEPHGKVYAEAVAVAFDLSAAEINSAKGGKQTPAKAKQGAQGKKEDPRKVVSFPTASQGGQD